MDTMAYRPYLSSWENHFDPKDRTMAQDTQLLSISARKLQAQADAVLDQMFAYFTREETPRVVETRRAA